MLNIDKLRYHFYRPLNKLFDCIKIKEDNELIYFYKNSEWIFHMNKDSSYCVFNRNNLIMFEFYEYRDKNFLSVINKYFKQYDIVCSAFHKANVSSYYKKWDNLHCY